MAFTITGQAGAAMTATARTFETLRVARASVEFKSMGVDVFSYTSEADNSAGAGVVLPEEGQFVSLFEGATRRFKGVVTRVTPGESAWDIEVSGPWWWMEKIPLTGDLTDPSGAASSRTNFVVPTQNLATSIRDLIDRMLHADVGVPMTRGAVDGAFPMIKQSFPNMSCAAALVQMLAWIPDAVTWFDYSGTTPELRVGRRDNLTVRTWTVGTSNIVKDSIAIRAATGLQVSRVELNFADRHPTTGRIRYQKQASGPATPGKVLAIPVSGPETVAFLPKSDFVSAMVTTAAAGAVPASHVLLNDAGLAALKKQYSSVPGGIASNVIYWSGAISDRQKVKVVKPFPPLRIAAENGGQITNLAGKYLVLSPDFPQWALEQYKGIKVTIQGTWVAVWRDSEKGPVPWSKVFKDFYDGSVTKAANLYENSEPVPLVGPPGSAGNRLDYAARPFTVSGVLIQSVAGLPTNPPWVTAKRTYKKWDYDFVQPPAGLATDLQAAANWVPYEGKFAVVSDAVSPLNQIPSRVRIANSRTDLATMDALVKSIRYDLMGGVAEWRLGAPARIDFGTLVNRVKREPSDNIEYL